MFDICKCKELLFAGGSTIKDTHWQKAPSNKTPALTKSMDMDIWVVRTSNQLFLRDSQAETKSKNIK